MNRRLALTQVALFVVIALGCGYYVAGNVFGARTFGDPTRVTVRMRGASGITPGALVTYRGAEVGSVADVRIRDDGAGVNLRLSIAADARIPADTEVVVTVNTPVGITHLDLRPRSDGAPYLDDSSVLSRADVTRPPPLERVLVDFMRLAENLPTEDIARLTKALSTGLDGMGPELSRLLDNTGALLDSGDERLAQLKSTASHVRELVDSGVTEGGRIRSLARSMRALTGGLREIEPSVRELVHRVPDTATKVAELISRTRSSVGTLLGNVVTSSRVISVRTPALEQALTSLPRALREMASIVEGDTANFYLVATQGPVCYYQTDRRSPTQTKPREPRLNWRCPGGQADLQQRGAANAPRPSSPAPQAEIPAHNPAPEPNSRKDQPSAGAHSGAANAEPLPFDLGSAASRRVLGPRSWSSILLRGAK